MTNDNLNTVTRALKNIIKEIDRIKTLDKKDKIYSALLTFADLSNSTRSYLLKNMREPEIKRLLEQYPTLEKRSFDHPLYRFREILFERIRIGYGQVYLIDAWDINTYPEKNKFISDTLENLNTVRSIVSAIFELVSEDRSAAARRPE